MLISIESLLDLPVMSLQTGAQLAKTSGVIVDPRQLTIAAFYVEGSGLEQSPAVLHPSDIRELSDIGFIVDDTTKLMSLDGLVRLKNIIDFDFELVGLKVIDEHKRKLGKVSGYSVETVEYTIVQLYTERSLMRSISTMSTTIHRSQVISVNNKEVIVQAPHVTEDVKNTAKEVGRAFVNPFRGSNSLPPD